VIVTNAGGDSVQKWQQGGAYDVAEKCALNVTLCCSGASKNKPFCDGSHASINF
jgi:CDGSH-type Zn-finger protein